MQLESYDPRLRKICMMEGEGLSSNVYAIGDRAITLVDTGTGDMNNLLAPSLRKLNLNLSSVETVILTHTHFDHTGGMAEIARASSPRVLVYKDEKEDVETYGLELVRMNEGEIMEVGDHRLQVIHTSGHTLGSVCLHDSRDRILFSGDTVFPDGSFGRTDLGGNDDELIDSLRLLTDLQVDFLLPGHMRPVIGNAAPQIKMSYQNALTWLKHS